jgi:hypothetical protein
MAIVAVCALVAASCGGSDDSETASSHGAAPTETTVHEPDIAAPVTVWDEFLAEMDDDGRVSKDTALEAFALAYGPIPEVSGGGRIDDRPVVALTSSGRADV